MNRDKYFIKAEELAKSNSITLNSCWNNNTKEFLKCIINKIRIKIYLEMDNRELYLENEKFIIEKMKKLSQENKIQSTQASKLR